MNYSNRSAVNAASWHALSGQSRIPLYAGDQSSANNRNRLGHFCVILLYAVLSATRASFPLANTGIFFAGDRDSDTWDRRDNRHVQRHQNRAPEATGIQGSGKAYDHLVPGAAVLEDTLHCSGERTTLAVVARPQPHPRRNQHDPTGFAHLIRPGRSSAGGRSTSFC